MLYNLEKENDEMEKRLGIWVNNASRGRAGTFGINSPTEDNVTLELDRVRRQEPQNLPRFTSAEMLRIIYHRAAAMKRSSLIHSTFHRHATIQ